MHFFQISISWTERCYQYSTESHPLHILYDIKMELEIGTCAEGGNRSSPAPEEPTGILQLIDQLENIVDTPLPG